MPHIEYKRSIPTVRCRMGLNNRQHNLIMFLLLLTGFFIFPLTATAGNGFPLGSYYNQYPGVKGQNFLSMCISSYSTETERFTNVPTGWFGVCIRPDNVDDGIYLVKKADENITSDNTHGVNFLIKNFIDLPSPDDPDFYFNVCASTSAWDESEDLERFYLMEWDEQHRDIPLNYDETGSYSLFDIMDLRPVTLQGGYTYTFTLSITSLEDNDTGLGANLHLYLIKDSGQWLSNDDAVFELDLSCTGPDSIAAAYQVDAAAGGEYVVVIVNNSQYTDQSIDPRPRGDYALHIEDTATPPDMPNLITQSINIGNAVTGSNITIGFETWNSGDASADASISRVSVDGTVQCSSVAVSALTAGDYDYANCVVPSLSQGSHSVTICADSGATVAESNEQDNCRQTNFTVQAAITPLPDLENISIAPRSEVAGHDLYIDAIAKNIGTASAPSSLASAWIDGVLVCDGTIELEAADVGQIAWRKAYCIVNNTLSVGDHTLRVCVNDPETFQERPVGENCLEQPLTITPAPKPDLTVTDIFPMDVTEDQEFSLSVVVKNQGKAAAAACTGRFFMDSQLIWYAPVPALAPGEEHVITFRESGWNAGTHSLSFTVDYNNTVEESVEGNNGYGVSILVRPRVAKVYPDGHGLYPTIQSAVDAVTPGGRVQLTAGTYSGDGNRDINFHGRDVNIMGADDTATTINCEAGTENHVAFILANQERVKISNIRVINGANEFFGGALYISGHVSALIEDCIFEDNSANVGGAIYARAEAKVAIRRCQFLLNQGNTANHGGGAIYGDEVILDISDTLFFKNKGGAVSLNDSQLDIRNATFVANDDGIVLDGAASQLDMQRTIISDSSGLALINSTGHGYNASCSDLYNNSGGNWPGGPDAGLGQISDDPLFCDIDNLDFSLHSDSPCVPATCGLMGAFPIGCGSAHDTDNDGMDDDWERTYFGNLDQTASGDADKDGVSNYEEFVHNSDPTRADTDFDGMDDEYEIKYGLDPAVNDGFLDADGDGFCNLREYVGSSSPRDADSHPPAMDIQVSVGAIGNPIQTGTSNLPFATIGQGIEMAASGDTVRVHPGTYSGTGNHDLGIPGEKSLVLRSSDGPEVTVIDCENLGQAIHVYTGSASFTLDGFTLTNGLANWGGGLYIRSRPGNIEIRNCRFINNQANHGGGAVGVYGTTALFTDCVFENNTAHQDGGAVHIENSTITLRNCDFTKNHSAFDTDDNYGSGGAVFAHVNSALRLEGCRFSENIADAAGGAVATNNTDIYLTSVRFLTNQAGSDGGALYSAGSAAGTQLVNSFFLANHAGGKGGGLYVKDTDALQLVQLTLSYNDAATHAGDPVYLENCPLTTLQNSIIRGESGNVFALDGSELETRYSDSYLISFTLTNGGSITTGPGHTQADPLLSWDGHLQPGSPCIDAGDTTSLPPDAADLDGDGNTTEPLPLDLDGSPRILPENQAVDMGVFEYGRGLAAVYSTGDTVHEGPIFHGYSHSCDQTTNNLYENICTPPAYSPADWASGDFSVQWNGYLFVPESGTYTFASHYWVDGIIQIRVNNKTIVDMQTTGGGYSGQIYLNGGYWVPVSVSYATNGGSNNMILGWIPPGKTWEVVPRKYLAADDTGLRVKKNSILLLALPAIIHGGAAQQQP